MNSIFHSLFFALLALLAAAVSGHALAQSDYAIGFNPRSGDVWVDGRLGDLNVYGSGNADGFIDEVVVSYGAPRYLVREYVIDRRWPPGDVYYACALAHYAGLPCLEVLEIYERDHGQGWGVIAKRLGIKPGSAEFHALKGDMGKSHARHQGGGKSANPRYQGDDRAPHGGPDKAKPGNGAGKGKDDDKGRGKGKNNGPPHR